MEKKYYLIIPDVHGRIFWKECIDLYGKDAEKIIFLGDYIDPYPAEYIKPEDAIEEFNKILELKKNNLEKVVLLLGNHDCHYLYDFTQSTRYNYMKAREYKNLYRSNKELFQFAYQVENVLFTHAGVHPSWLKFNKLELPKTNIDEFLNNVDFRCYDQIGRSRGGYFSVGSPIWADIHDYDYYGTDEMPKVKQIVGHSMSLIHRGQDFNINDITCIDCIGGFFKFIPEEGIEEMSSKYLENYKYWSEKIKKEYGF